MDLRQLDHEQLTQIEAFTEYLRSKDSTDAQQMNMPGFSRKKAGGSSVWNSPIFRFGLGVGAFGASILAFSYYELLFGALE